MTDLEEYGNKYKYKCPFEEKLDKLSIKSSTGEVKGERVVMLFKQRNKNSSPKIFLVQNYLKDPCTVPVVGGNYLIYLTFVLKNCDKSTAKAKPIGYKV